MPTMPIKIFKFFSKAPNTYLLTKLKFQEKTAATTKIFPYVSFLIDNPDYEFYSVGWF